MRNMLKTFFSAAALAMLVATPSFAQDEEAAPAPRAASSYATIDYNLQDDRDNILMLDLSNGKRVAIRLMPDWAPHHVERIKTLARQGFYDGVIFHRVIDGFMAQTGDPTGTGQGGSELPDLKAEFNPMPHVRGTVSMARAQSCSIRASASTRSTPISAGSSPGWTRSTRSTGASRRATRRGSCRPRSHRTTSQRRPRHRFRR